MAVTLGILDVEEKLKQVKNPIIVNNLAADSDIDRRYIERISSTRFDKSEKLSSVPTCGCGAEKLGINLGVICDLCGTEVTMSASSLESELWIIAPADIPGLILPKFAIMLYDAMNIKKGHNGFEWMINPRYKTPRGNDSNTKRFIRLFGEMERGLKAFINNFDTVMDKIEIFRPEKARSIRSFYERYRGRVFPRCLPLPSRLTLLVEDTNVYAYYDKTMDKVLDAIYTVAGLSNESDNKIIQSRLGSAIISLSIYHRHVMKNIIGGKPGTYRRYLLGSRLSYALRTILTSIHEPHDYRYSRIPKSLACMVTFPALVGKLYREGWTLYDAYDYVKSNCHKPTEKMVSMLYELVEESKPLMKEITGRDDKYGLVFNMTRYPGLRLGSSKTYFVKEFSDDAIEWSVLTLNASNADFDGDEISGMWVQSISHIKAFLNLEPHMDIHSSRQAGKFSNTIDLPDTTVLTLHSKLESEEFAF